MTDKNLLAYCRSASVCAKHPERVATEVKNALAVGIPIEKAIATLKEWQPELFLGRRTKP